MRTSEREDLHLRIKELNKRFLAEVERGAGWNDIRFILEEMKDIARGLDHLPATIIDFDAYPPENRLSESGH